MLLSTYALKTVNDCSVNVFFSDFEKTNTEPTCTAYDGPETVEENAILIFYFSFGGSRFPPLLCTTWKPFTAETTFRILSNSLHSRRRFPLRLTANSVTAAGSNYARIVYRQWGGGAKDGEVTNGGRSKTSVGFCSQAARVNNGAYCIAKNRLSSARHFNCVREARKNSVHTIHALNNRDGQRNA